MSQRLGLPFVTAGIVFVCASVCSAFLDYPGDPLVHKFVAYKDGGMYSQGSETRNNAGAKANNRCKGSQEMPIMDFDLSSLAGRTVIDAELIAFAVDSLQLYAADVSTITVPWIEGTGTNSSTAAVGEPCWNWRQYPADVNNPQPADYWLPGASSLTPTYRGNFTIATYGNNGSLVCYAYPADGGFTTFTASGTTAYRIKLDPDVVHALMIQLPTASGADRDQYGLTLSDTRGYLLQNNRIYMHDQSGGAYGPWLYVKVADTATDATPPGAVTGLAAAAKWNGQVMLSWTAPADSGPKGKAFGYDVRYSQSPITTDGDFTGAALVDRWRIPRPTAPGTPQKMLVENLTPDTTYYFAIKAYDQAGNITAMVSTSTVLPAVQTVKAFTNGGFTAPTAAASVPSVPNVLNYWAVSDYTKVNPVTGNRLVDGYTGSTGDTYKKGNPVWDAVNNKVVLKAARNEVVAFQVILQNILPGGASLTNVQVSVGDLVRTIPSAATILTSPNIELFRTWYLSTGGAWYPQSCIPLAAPFGTTFAIPNANNNITGQTNQAVWVDIYVPKDKPQGTYNGTITVTATQLTDPLNINLQLDVRSWQLPDVPTFTVDLNGYGAVWSWSTDVPGTKLKYFQLAQKHRQVINTVPYSHSLNNAANNFSARVNYDRTPNSDVSTQGLTGTGAGIHVANWTGFDTNWGPYLDGTAFTPAQGYNGPGMGKGHPCLILPFYESWPLSSYWWYDWAGLGGAYWYTICPGPSLNISYLSAAPDPAKAYPAAYETGLKNIIREFAEHAQAMGWWTTDFQVFFNDKFSFGTASNPHSAFWNLDEPSEGDCFQVMGYLMNVYRQGVATANAPNVKFLYRLDISTRTGHNRGKLDGILNWWCCSAIDDYHVLLPYRQLNWSDERWYYYGTTGTSNASEMTNPRRFMQVWAWGADGALPYWDCYTNQNSWTSEADPYPVVLSGQSVPGASGVYNGAVPTVRMKEMRRGQQDIEYLNYLTGSVSGWDRAAVIRALRAKYSNSGGQSYSGMNELKFFQMREDTAASVRVIGDVNGDGHVNVADLNIMAATWSKKSGDPGFDARADLNGDGKVTLLDLNILAQSWGT